MECCSNRTKLDNKRNHNEKMDVMLPSLCLLVFTIHVQMICMLLKCFLF